MACIPCQDKVNHIDYKQTDVLRKFVSGQFKIKPNKHSEFCRKHQRMLASAVKLARYMALMPYMRTQTRKK